MAARWSRPAPRNRSRRSRRRTPANTCALCSQKEGRTRMPPVARALCLALAVCSTTRAAQVPFEHATRDLTSADPGARLRAAQMLKESPYPEAAVPLAPLITDHEDDVQLAAIAAELNIFLAEKVVVRKRVGFVVEVRNQIVAEKAFAAGPLAIGPRPVPPDVLAALRTASADDNPRVALEALYAFGTLAV